MGVVRGSVGLSGMKSVVVGVSGVASGAVGVMRLRE